MATIKLTGLNNIGQITGIGTQDHSAIDGSVTLGDADNDSIIVNAEFDSDLVPDDDEQYSLGESNKRWRNVFAGVYYGDGSNLTGVQTDLQLSGENGAIQYRDGDTLEGAGQFYYKSGKVGIGDFQNDNPVSALHIKGNFGGGQNQALLSMTDYGFAPTLSLGRYNGNSQNPSGIADNDPIGQIAFLGFNPTVNGLQTGAMIKAEIDGTPSQSSTDMPTALKFMTTHDGGGTPTTRMIIKPTGYVGIGTQDPVFTLDVHNGGIRTLTSSGGSLNVANSTINPSIGTNLGSVQFGTVEQFATAEIVAKTDANWSSSNRATYLDFKTVGSNSTSSGIRIQLSDQECAITPPTTVQNTLKVDQNIEVNNNLGYVAVKATNTNIESKLALSTLETGSVYANAFVTNNAMNPSIPSLVIMTAFSTTDNAIQVNPSGKSVGYQVFDSLSEIPLAINTSGKTYLGTQNGEPQHANFEWQTTNGVHIEGDDSDGSALVVVNRYQGTNADGVSIIIGLGSRSNSNGTYDYPTTSNRFLKFYSKTRPYGTLAGATGVDADRVPEQIGYVRGDGVGGVAYIQSFTGLHASIIDTVEITNGAITGMIVESTGHLWHSATGDNVSTALPKTTLASTSKSKRVYGVLGALTAEFDGYVSASPLKETETLVEINSLGEGKVWITNLKGNIENGDYITSSEIKGFGELQDDDLLHNYTVAKITESIDWESVSDTIEHNGQTYKKYLSACTYHCG